VRGMSVEHDLVGSTPTRHPIDAIRAKWVDANWLWSAHLVASHVGCTVRAARRALKQMLKAGEIEVYVRNASAGKTLYRRVL
jgi:hypothetical protein